MEGASKDAVQGIGAALLIPCSLAIIGATFEESERGKAIGTWAGFRGVILAGNAFLLRRRKCAAPIWLSSRSRLLFCDRLLAAQPIPYPYDWS
jgi:MFS family permease